MMRHSLALLRRCSSVVCEVFSDFQLLKVDTELKQGEGRLTFSVLHHNGGVLEEGDEEVAGLKVGIERQFWVVHHCNTAFEASHVTNVVEALIILRNVGACLRIILFYYYY